MFRLTSMLYQKKRNMDPNFQRYMSLQVSSEQVAQQTVQTVKNAFDDGLVNLADFISGQALQERVIALARSNDNLFTVLENSMVRQRRVESGIARPALFDSSNKRHNRRQAGTIHNMIRALVWYSRFLGYRFENLDRFTAKLSFLVARIQQNMLVGEVIFNSHYCGVYNALVNALRVRQHDVIDPRIRRFQTLGALAENEHTWKAFVLSELRPFVELVLRFCGFPLTVATLTARARVHLSRTAYNRMDVLSSRPLREELRDWRNPNQVLFLLDPSAMQFQLLMVRYKNLSSRLPERERELRLVAYTIPTAVSVYLYVLLTYGSPDFPSGGSAQLLEGDIAVFRRWKTLVDDVRGYALHQLELPQRVLEPLGIERGERLVSAYSYRSKLVWLSAALNYDCLTLRRRIERFGYLSSLVDLGIAKEHELYNTTLNSLQDTVDSQHVAFQQPDSDMLPTSIPLSTLHTIDTKLLAILQAEAFNIFRPPADEHAVYQAGDVVNNVLLPPEDTPYGEWVPTRDTPAFYSLAIQQMAVKKRKTSIAAYLEMARKQRASKISQRTKSSRMRKTPRKLAE